MLFSKLGVKISENSLLVIKVLGSLKTPSPPKVTTANLKTTLINNMKIKHFYLKMLQKVKCLLFGYLMYISPIFSYIGLVQFQRKNVKQLIDVLFLFQISVALLGLDNEHNVSGPLLFLGVHFGNRSVLHHFVTQLTPDIIVSLNVSRSKNNFI